MKKAAKRSYPFPDLVTLDFSRYPEIKAVIFDTAQKLLLPVEHVAVSLISEGIIARMKKS